MGLAYIFMTIKKDKLDTREPGPKIKRVVKEY
mgnify:CR=1 FL=1